jgi:hypothetical protein
MTEREKISELKHQLPPKFIERSHTSQESQEMESGEE